MAIEITGHTGLTGLLGSPVAHSISPSMHNEAFRQLDLDYVYLCFDVGTDKLPKAVEGLKTMNVRGFNLTMPNKNLMTTLCDKLSPASELSGAVNTVVNDNGILTGHTTDGKGFMLALADEGYHIIGEKMTLFGAGGVATAMLVQAALDGVSEISVFSIHDSFYDRAKKIVNQLNERTNCKVRLFDFDDDSILRKEIKESAIIVNGTSVGMAPKADACILKDSSYFHKGQIVFDAIYNPKETKLLTLAKEQDCITCNGLYMLLYQGAEAFKLWTGKKMPVEIMKEKYFKK